MPDSITPDDLETAMAALVCVLLMVSGLILVSGGFALLMLDVAAGAVVLYAMGAFVMFHGVAHYSSGWVRDVYYALPWKDAPDKRAVTERTWSNGGPVGSGN